MDVGDTVGQPHASLRLRAKQAFRIGDILKSGPFESVENLRESLAAAEIEVEMLAEAELDGIIGRSDSDRLVRYNQAVWRFGTVNLGDCHVWPKMGSRQWAVGRVFDVAKEFQREANLNDRVWNMRRFAQFFRTELPIIVLESHSGLHIDDGSHRAVTMSLGGVEAASAWIGRSPPKPTT